MTLQIDRFEINKPSLKLICYLGFVNSIAYSAFLGFYLLIFGVHFRKAIHHLLHLMFYLLLILYILSLYLHFFQYCILMIKIKN